MENQNLKFKDEIKDKTILITGGTGSFGRYIIRKLLCYAPRKIIVFSRDEYKQNSMELEYKSGYVNLAPDDQFCIRDDQQSLRMDRKGDILDFVLGDVRDLGRLLEATKGVDLIFHAAALKQVPLIEYHPFEAVKTNIIGAYNVKVAAIKNAVKRVINISTDKAVKPVNAMGMTKAIQEKIMLSENEVFYDTVFACVRYGNVIGSRGSVIPLFKKKIELGEPLQITVKEMTRFLLTLEEAINLVFHATVYSKGGEIFIKKSPACRMFDLAKVMAGCISGNNDYPIVEIGIRPGEKIHEVLVSEEEMYRTREDNDFFVVYPHRVYLEKSKNKEADFFSKLQNKLEYTSSNTTILDSAKIAELLKKTGWI